MTRQAIYAIAWQSLLATSWVAVSLNKRGFTMRFDDVTGNICKTLHTGSCREPRRSRHRRRRRLYECHGRAVQVYCIKACVQSAYCFTA